MADNRFAQYGPPTTNRFAPPALPYEAPQAAANLTKTTQDVTKGAATLSYDVAKAKSEAKSAKIDADTKQEQWDISHPNPNAPGGMLTGPAYLHWLQQSDPGRAAYIQGLSEGRVAFPGPQMMRSPAGMALLNQVMRADPTIDATNFATRAAARKNAATGHLSDSDNNFITAIGHLARLNTLVPETFGTPIRPLNWAANELDKNFFGGGQTAYEQNQQLAGNELAGAYGAKTEGKQNEGGSQFNENYSTGQKTKNVSGAVDLLMSKLSANRAQFAYGNGQLSKPDFMLLPPGVREQVMSLPGGKEAAAKYFSGIQVMGQNGSNNPPPSGGSGGVTPPAPPPTGPAGSLTASSNGISDTPDPRSAASWENSARQGLSYADALKAASDDAKARGLNTVEPIPPGAYDKAAAYIKKYPNVPYTPFSGVRRDQLSGTADTIFNDIAQNPGGAFAGHYYNNLFAGLPGKLAGDRHAYFNEVSNQQNPWASFAGDALGMAGSASLAGKGVGAISDAAADAPILGRYLRGIGVNPAPGLTGEEARAAQTAAAIRRNVTGDMISSGVTGANNNPEHPVLGAAANMAAIGTGNVLGRYAFGPALSWAGDTAPGQAVVNGARSLGALVKKPFGGGAPAPFSPPSPVDPNNLAILKQANGSMDTATQNLQDAARFGLPYTLADAVPSARMMLGSAIRKSPDVRNAATDFLQSRQDGVPERAIQAVNNNLAPVVDVPTAKTDILNSARAQSGPLYDVAKSQPVPELTANPALQDVLDRPAAATAVRNGYNTALNNGEDVGTLTYATGPNGETIQYGNPSWNVIHYARQELDKAGETSARQALDKQIAAINPNFKAADAKFSGIMKGSDALQAGSDATNIKVTPEATQRAMASFPDNGPQFQQGYASNLADMIGTNKGQNPYRVVSGSPFQRQNIGTVFPDGAPDFMRTGQLEKDMNETYTEGLRGAQTQPRAEADKMWDGVDLGADALQTAVTGMPSLGTGLTLLRKAGLLDRWNMRGLDPDKVGPALMNPDATANLANLNDWIKQNAARKAYLNQANASGVQLGAGLLGAPAISLFSQN